MIDIFVHRNILINAGRSGLRKSQFSDLIRGLDVRWPKKRADTMGWSVFQNRRTESRCDWPVMRAGKIK
jgi:hypothetical protein